MAMAQAAADWTAERVRSLPDDGQRHEAVDGVLLVTPAPSWAHQHAVGLLHLKLATFLATHPVGHVVLAPADVELDPLTLVQPDLFVVPSVSGRRPRDWAEAGSLLLAVEILSPSTARADRHLKRRRYQRAGVPEYWIVDLDARLVERWRPEDERPEIVAERLVWRSTESTDCADYTDYPALEIELPAFFTEVLGEP